MAEKMSEVYEMYDIQIEKTGRGRGAILLYTDKGLLQVRPETMREERLRTEYNLKEQLVACGFTRIDRLVENREQSLLTYDRYGNPFAIRTYYEGRELNVCNETEILQAVSNLVSLHKAGREILQYIDGDILIRSRNNMRRRNQEMKRVFQFISKQSPRREFEDLYLKAFPYFYEQGLACEKAERPFDLQEYSGYCHGNYTHHSVLLCEGGALSTVGFDKAHIGNQLDDLYYFLRKTVEKNGYSFSLYGKMIESYRASIPLSEDALQYLCHRYAYPEKFYKLSNQYINGTKNWISPKMLEKLKRIQEEEEKKQILLQAMKKFG